MSVIGIIMTIVLIGTIGFLIGIFLGIVGNKFAIEVDEREIKVREQLPGNNCGGCGYPGCDGLARAIVQKEAPINACPVGGDLVAKAIAKVLGEEIIETKRMVAFIKCSGDCENTKQKYQYSGIEDCKMMQFVPNGGAKACSYGCLGFGSCARVCDFDAIHFVNGIAVIDQTKCKACKKCIDQCPKKLIELVPYEQEVYVACNSKEKAKAVMRSCDIGCIGCKKCEKSCPVNAITVEDNIAHIDYTKCINCGLCREQCKRSCIKIEGKNIVHRNKNKK